MERMNAKRSTLLGDARDWLRERLKGGGAQCPLCEQLAHLYKRPLEASMSMFLIRAYRTHALEWFHAPNFVRGDTAANNAVGVGGTYSKLAHWGLLEEATEKREDGGRAGWWRITEKGERFFRGEITVPKYILIYNAKLIGHEGPEWTLADALGKKFNYREVMEG